MWNSLNEDVIFNFEIDDKYICYCSIPVIQNSTEPVSNTGPTEIFNITEPTEVINTTEPTQIFNITEPIEQLNI